MKALIALLLAATLALLFARHENSVLKRALGEASQLAAARQQTLNRLTAERSALAARLEHNNTLQAGWRQKLAEASEASVRQEQTIARLLNENEAARRWYSSALPDAVRRVHQRPACPSAGRCSKPLSAGGALPDAGKSPAN